MVRNTPKSIRRWEVNSHINTEWWDRCEKVIYLIVDGALNVYFILIVKQNLISNGLAKYKRLTNFNIFIICFSLSMDVLIISMMSLNNTFVYVGRSCLKPCYPYLPTLGTAR